MTNSEFAAGLRGLADIYEQHPEMAVPTEIDVSLYGISREDFARTIKAIGACKKMEPKAWDSYFFTVEKTIGGAPVHFRTARANVCRKVRVMKEVEDWDCTDPLLEAAVAEA